MLSGILIFPKIPPDPLPPPILYEYKIANFPETLDHIPKHYYCIVQTDIPMFTSWSLLNWHCLQKRDTVQ